ncbi:hypothetical protein Mapa_003774 [Marchantia paleacea]|nr:hypothetical protein Mapa_003774 [Marchantia paleacea]
MAEMEKSGESIGVQQLLRNFLDTQHRRASAYSLWHKGFTEYMKASSDDAFNKLCGQVTIEFSECSTQVKDTIVRLKDASLAREDLASVLEAVQIQESQKLQMTSVLQVLRKAGRPSERASMSDHKHESTKGCSHACTHGSDAETGGLEMAQLDAEFEAAIKEATGAVQDATLAINEHMEEIRYEIEDLGEVQAEDA